MWNKIHLKSGWILKHHLIEQFSVIIQSYKNLYRLYFTVGLLRPFDEHLNSSKRGLRRSPWNHLATDLVRRLPEPARWRIHRTTACSYFFLQEKKALGGKSRLRPGLLNARPAPPESGLLIFLF